MNIFYPVIPRRRWIGILKISALGAVVAGLYGALHDQLSYAISPEYFTKMKFEQFWYANFGWPQRVYASEVGFLASWWVGGIGGWILARFGLDELPNPPRRATIAKAVAMVFGAAILFGGGGLILGEIVAGNSDLHGWKHMQDVLEIQNLPPFVVVAYLHWGSYLGALVGIVCAIFYVGRCVKRQVIIANQPGENHTAL